MRRLASLAALLLATGAALAEQPAAPPAADAGATLVTARAIRARAVIGPGDVAVSAGATPGALEHAQEALGMEARTWLQAGQAIMPEDLAPPAMVERNQIVVMRFRRGMLEINTDGRALERAAEGERVRVMNLTSRATVTGTVIAPGLVEMH